MVSEGRVAEIMDACATMRGRCACIAEVAGCIADTCDRLSEAVGAIRDRSVPDSVAGQVLAALLQVIDLVRITRDMEDVLDYRNRLVIFAMEKIEMLCGKDAGCGAPCERAGKEERE